MNNAYEQGFIDKCARLGIDPAVIVKSSQIADLLKDRGSMFGDIMLSPAARDIKDIPRGLRYAVRSDLGRAKDVATSPYVSTRGKRTYQGAVDLGGKGALTGAGVGAGLGALIGGRKGDSSDDPGARVARALIAALIGAGIGTAAGGVVGGIKGKK